MVGFGSLVFVPNNSIILFGIFSSIGVLFAFLLTIFLLPLMLDLWSPVSEKRATRFARDKNKLIFIQKVVDKFNRFSKRRPRFIIFTFLSVGAIGFWGATMLKVDIDWVRGFKDDSPIKTAFFLADKVMGGVQSMEIYINMGETDALKDPRVLNAMDTFQNSIESKYSPLLAKTNSLVDIVKNTNQVLNENREEFYQVPQNGAVLEQTLFLFNNANPEDRRHMVSDDYSQARISINAGYAGYAKLVELITNVEREKELVFSSLKSAYPNMKVDLTGGLRLDVQTNYYTGKAFYRSFLQALIVISLLLLFIFGSLRVGLFVAMIPNLLPVVTIFGLMGWLGLPIEPFSALIAPIIIGLAVDDTIHFLTNYRMEVLKSGDIEDAIDKTLKEVGQAVIFTSVILALGFGVMAFSSYLFISNFGIFSALAILVALLGDLLLLPASCRVLKVRFDSKWFQRKKTSAS